MKKVIYFICVVFIYGLMIFCSAALVAIRVQDYKVEKYGVPVQCEILSVEEHIESVDDSEDDSSHDVIVYETCVKYNIDGKEYTDTVDVHLGEKGKVVELLYLPSKPEKIYCKVYEETTRLMDQILIGWFAFWIIFTISMICIFRKGRNSRTNNRR